MSKKRLRNPSRPCAVCADTSEAAELSLRREPGAAHHFPLCAADFEWAADVLERSGKGLVAGSAPLGVPAREAAPMEPGNRCGACNAGLGAESFVLDLVPSSREMSAGPVRRHSGRIYQVGLCRQCHAWWETTLRDAAAIRGESSRSWEGPPGGWLATVRSDVATTGLGARDDETIAATVGAVGCRSHRYSFDDIARLPSPPAVLFVAASAAGRASRMLSRLPEAFRRVCVIVGRPDALDDLAAALRLGAADFLAWPLSPQQVAGAIDRVARPGGGVEERDAETGLPLLDGERRIHNRTAIRLGATLPGGMSLLEGALLARRFLRGYDVVGIGARGYLSFAVVSEPVYLPRIIARMELVLGEGSRVWEGEPPAAREFVSELEPSPESPVATGDPIAGEQAPASQSAPDDAGTTAVAEAPFQQAVEQEAPDHEAAEESVELERAG